MKSVLTMQESKSRGRPILVALLLIALGLWMAGCGTDSTSVNLAGEGTGTTTLVGTVVDGTSGEEVMGALVAVEGLSATTDWGGHYQIQGAPAGSQAIGVSCDGYLAWKGTVALKASAVTNLNISIYEPSQVQGTVVEGQTGTPLPGATVTLGTVVGTSDANGTYLLTGVSAGPQGMDVTKKGYVSGSALVQVVCDETSTQDFTLYPQGTTGTVQGRVTDSIAAMNLGGVQLTVQNTVATSNTRGDYVLSGAPAGTQLLGASLEGYGNWRQTIQVGDGTTVTCNVGMARPGAAGSVQGQILDMATQKELKGATVTIGLLTTTSGEHGDFSFVNVPVGTPTVVVSKPGYLDQNDSVLVEPDAVAAKTLTLSKTPLRKGPYLLYNNDISRMTVLWQTFNTPAQAKIEWGTTTAYGHSATVTENSASMGEHRFSHAITGLAPDTTIHYQVSVDGQSEKGSFTSAPDPSASKVSFYSYGDTRAHHALWGASNEHDLVCQAIVADMKAAAGRQSIILHDGDVVRHGLDESYWDCQYFMRAFPAQLELESKLPIMASLGNHECYESNDAGTDLVNGGALLRKYWPYAYPRQDRFYYSFDYGPVHFAAIDNWMHPDYQPGTDQYQWLQQDLGQSGKPWKVVFMHTPPWDCNTVDHGIVTGLSPLLKQAGVKLVIAGHAHHYCRCIVDGITYLTMGGGGAPLGGLANPYNPESAPYVQKAENAYHFGRFEVSGDKIQVTIIKPDGKELENFTIQK